MDKEKIAELDRPTYDKLKECRISTLTLNAALEAIGIEISQRTLQHYLDSDFRNTNDDRLKKVALAMINNHGELIKNLKTLI